MDGSLFAKLWAITTANASNNGTMVHTINDMLIDEISSYEQSKATSSASDTHSTASSSFGQPKVVQVRCLAHVLQLAVKEGLKRCPLMDDSVGVIRDILKKLHESPSLLEALREVCASVNMKYIAPELDCVTRWNSTLTMLASARSLKEAIGELERRIRGHKDFSIAPGDRLAAPIPETTWTNLVKLITFLRPIKGATTLMSGQNYPTFGVALVVYHLVSKHASKTVENAVSWHTKDFARAFKTKLDEYIPFVKTNEAQIAAALDPRAKGILVTIGIEITQVKRLVEAEYESVHRSAYERSQTNANSVEKTQLQKEEADAEEPLYSLIDEYIQPEFP